MFDHSIKVPRLYKSAAKIAKEVSESKGSIKQLVYESKHPNIKGLYALVVHIFQRTDNIEKLLKKSKLLIKEPRFDPWLAKVLITELLWGKKRLSGQSKPVKTILAYEQIFKAHLSDTADDFEDCKQVEKPRYVRVNTLKITVNEAIEGFRDEGWVLKRYTDTSNYLGFLEAVANLNSEEFMVDFHIPYLLIFPPKTEFHQHPAYKNGSILLQDKASCLPVFILDPKPGSVVLDMCAAPGMKTTQCAAVMDDKGQIYAVEVGKKRFQILNKMVENSGATCIKTIKADVLTLSHKDCPDVEYIIVDPSCSGSGITDRVEIGQQEIEQHKNRLEKLAAFQLMMLRHAFTKFPAAKRVVYSTCSVYPEENEDVVRRVLETCRNFKLVPARHFVNNNWENFGSSEFGDIGNYCLYAKPDIDLTSGFFVAVFERLEEGESNRFFNMKLFNEVDGKFKLEKDDNVKREKIIKIEDKSDWKIKKKDKIKREFDSTDVEKKEKIKEECLDEMDGCEKKKKKNVINANEADEDSKIINKIKYESEKKNEELKEECLDEVEGHRKKRKKKFMNIDDESATNNTSACLEEMHTNDFDYSIKQERTEDVPIDKPNKKRKYKRECVNLDESISENLDIGDAEKLYKKKKKKKEKREAQEIETVEIDETPKKKKKKKMKNEEIEG